MSNHSELVYLTLSIVFCALKKMCSRFRNRTIIPRKYIDKITYGFILGFIVE